MKFKYILGRILLIILVSYYTIKISNTRGRLNINIMFGQQQIVIYFAIYIIITITILPTIVHGGSNTVSRNNIRGGRRLDSVFSGHCQKSGCRTSPNDVASGKPQKKILDPADSLENYRKNPANHAKYYAADPRLPAAANSDVNNNPGTFMTLVAEWVFAFLLLRFVVMFARGNGYLDQRTMRKIQQIKDHLIDVLNQSWGNVRSSVMNRSQSMSDLGARRKRSKAAAKTKSGKKVASGVRDAIPSERSVASLGSLVDLIGWDDEESQSTYTSAGDYSEYSDASTKFKNDWNTKHKKKTEQYDDSTIGDTTNGEGYSLGGQSGLTTLLSDVAIADNSVRNSHSPNVVQKRKAVTSKKHVKKSGPDSLDDSLLSSQIMTGRRNDPNRRSDPSLASESVLSKFVDNLFTSKKDKKKRDDGKLRSSLQKDDDHHRKGGHKDKPSRRRTVDNNDVNHKNSSSNGGHTKKKTEQHQNGGQHKNGHSNTKKKKESNKKEKRDATEQKK